MADVDLMTNPMTTAGDVIYGGTAGAPTRVGIGTAGQVLKVNAGATAPEWDDESGGAGGGPTVVRKTADETVNTSAALQDDDHLLLALGANEVWEFEVYLWYSSGTTPDLKYTFTVPTGGAVDWSDAGIDATATQKNENVVSAATETRTSFGSGVGVKRFVRLWGVVVNGANAGNLQLQWAQNTSNGSDTVVYTNSTLKAYQLV